MKGDQKNSEPGAGGMEDLSNESFGAQPLNATNLIQSEDGQQVVFATYPQQVFKL